jgi:hypothetical protein
MASDSSKSTPASKYDVNSQIAALLEKYFTSPTSSTRPSAVFTSGPNKGLPVSALPPSVTPFRQRGNVQRTSKVSAETARARQQREARTQTPDQVDERRRRNENDRIIRDQQARARREDRARRPRPVPPSDEYGPPIVSRAPTTEDEIRRQYEIRSGNIPQRKSTPARNLGPSALSQALGRIEAQPPVSSIFRNTPGPTAADYARAQEDIDLANTQRAFDVGYARKDRELGMEDIANTQAEYRRRDEERRRQIAELDANAFAKHMAAVRAGRPSSSVMPRYDLFDPLASIGNLLGFGD